MQLVCSVNWFASGSPARYICTLQGSRIEWLTAAKVFKAGDNTKYGTCGKMVGLSRVICNLFTARQASTSYEYTGHLSKACCFSRLMTETWAASDNWKVAPTTASLRDRRLFSFRNIACTQSLSGNGAVNCIWTASEHRPDPSSTSAAATPHARTATSVENLSFYRANLLVAVSHLEGPHFCILHSAFLHDALT